MTTKEFNNKKRECRRVFKGKYGISLRDACFAFKYGDYDATTELMLIQDPSFWWFWNNVYIDNKDMTVLCIN